MDLLRLYLLSGLVAHKAVWELMKRRRPGYHAQQAALSPIAKAAKAVKIMILLGLVAQTFLPEIAAIAADPALVRWIGALLFTIGSATAISARIRLGEHWSDIEAAVVAPGQQLVDGGVYAYLRHPIYAGDLLLLAGFELALNSWLALGVLLLAPVVIQRALGEERMLTENLPGYVAYRGRVKSFIPFLL